MLWLISTLVIILLTLLYYYKPRSDLPNVHGPKRLSIFSTIFRKPYDILTVEMLAACKKYPRIFQFRMNSADYAVHEPKLIKEILVEKANVVVNHPNPGIKIYHKEKIPTTNSLISIRDDEWKKRRKMLAPAFNSTKITGFFDIFAQEVGILCEILRENVGKEIDMQKTFARLTVDVLGRTVFGSNFNSQRDPTNQLSKDVENFVGGIGGAGVMLLLPLWYKFPNQGIRRFLSGTNNLMEICRQIVVKRGKNNETHHNDLLQILIDLNLDLETGLLPESLLFMIAGHETTSNLLSWTVFLVAQHPEVEEKIVQEIRDVLKKDDHIDSENIELFHYLDCVIQESLRLYPPAMATDRETNAELEFDGKIFPKGSTFIIPIWAVHHNEKYWPNPDKFDPTRFDAEHKHNIEPFSYLPFGGGPRICIGMKFALTESKLALAKIYQEFTLKLTDLESCKPAAVTVGGLLKPEKVLMNIRKR